MPARSILKTVLAKHRVFTHGHGKREVVTAVAFLAGFPRSQELDFMSSSTVSISYSQRLDFFGVSSQDYARFPKIRRAFARYAPAALDSFYEKVRSTPETAGFFANEAVMRHARGKQVEHWDGLFSGQVSEIYFEKAETIGNIHARIGLEPSWYIGAYARVLSQIITKMSSLGGGMVNGSAIASLVKLAMLDMDVALSAYFKAEEKARQSVVDELSAALGEVAKGNFTQALPKLPDSFGKIEEDFEKMRTEIQAALQSVSQKASTINIGASEISQASNDLASRTEQQAASLEKTVNDMEVLSSGVSGAAEGAKKMSEVVIETKKKVETGREVVSEAVDSMQEIQSSASEIETITDLIDGIAFQTNLLALNAGVEAARAGEAGKGFAVVATEVRQLAQRSAEAANEIKTLIGNSVDQIERGAELVGKSGTEFEGIATRVENIENLATSIAQVSHEQSQSVQNVNSAIREMDRMTQQNAAMSEQSNAASKNLADAAGNLNHLVGRFTLSASANGAQQSEYAATPSAVPSPTPPPAPPPAPSVSHQNTAPSYQSNGNLALADDDWSEF